MDLEYLIKEIESNKLGNDERNNFKEAYNTGIDVAIGVVERWQNIFQNCIERGEHD